MGRRSINRGHEAVGGHSARRSADHVLVCKGIERASFAHFLVGFYDDEQGKHDASG
jgi:hypothetical protein